MFNRNRIESDFEKLTEQEQEERLDYLRENLDRKDEFALILAAMRTFFPPVLIFLFLIYLFAKLISLA